MSSLGLRMDNNVIQVAVKLRLSLPLCEPHYCQRCGIEVDSLGTHGLSCHYSRGHHPYHAEINGIIQRSLRSVKIPCFQEPTCLYRSDSTRPDRVSIMRGDKVLVWDVTCPDTLATSYSAVAAREAGAAESEAESREESKLCPSGAQSLLRAHSSGDPWCVGPTSPQFYLQPRTIHYGCHPGAPLPSLSLTTNHCGCSAREHNDHTGLHGGY